MLTATDNMQHFNEYQCVKEICELRGVSVVSDLLETPWNSSKPTTRMYRLMRGAFPLSGWYDSEYDAMMNTSDVCRDLNDAYNLCKGYWLEMTVDDDQNHARARVGLSAGEWMLAPADQPALAICRAYLAFIRNTQKPKQPAVSTAPAGTGA